MDISFFQKTIPVSDTDLQDLRGKSTRKLSDNNSLEIFLKYINSEGLCFAQSHVCDLLRLAFEYGVQHVTRKCVDFAINTLTLDNCVKYHAASTLYELHDLQAHSFGFMLRHGQSLLKHPSFVELDPFTLSMLISHDEFHIIETDLFMSLTSWIACECKRRNYPSDKKEFHQIIRGNLFQQVRYAQMTPKEINTVVVPTGILSPVDIEAIKLRHSCSPSFWPNLPKYQFTDRPRLVRQLVRVPMYSGIQMQQVRLTSPCVFETVRFLSSHNMFLTGIEFFGPLNAHQTSAYKVKYTIEDEFLSQYWRTPTESSTIMTPCDYDLEVPHPYRIDAQHPYKLSVWVEGFIYQYGVGPNPQAFVIANNNYITILFSDSKSELSSRFNSHRQSPSMSPGVIKSLLFQAAS